MNNRIKTLSVCLFCVLCSQVAAQTVYYDADQFPLIGKTSNETETRYERLPTCLKEVCRSPVWNLGKNSSGLAIRFRTNSTAISAKWEVTNDNRMSHMTETGIKGLDLYAWEKDHWQPVRAAIPSGKVNERTIISDMTPQDREFMLFLPLYDGVISLSIGIDSAAYILDPALPFPDTSHPVLVYGTSITQGGCASRPGMSCTNILTRRLNREVINLGFSGNGKLDFEIAELMATRHDASLFVLDFIPNVDSILLKEKTRPFFERLRKSNPDIPILFVETIIYPHSFYDKNTHQIITEKNRLLREEFEIIKHAGEKNVYYLANDGLIGQDGEASVDGIHLTDLGFYRLAERMYNTIVEILTKISDL